jgi:hypothetical protein
MIRALVVLVLGIALPTVTYAAVSPQCIEETATLKNSSFLNMVQDDLYTEYKEDFDSFCDFSSITNPDCGLKFDGENKTYVAACEDKQGQVLKRAIELKCGVIATIDFDLGVAPMCVGGSCDLSTIGPDDLNDTRFEQLLEDLSSIGCTTVSSARSAIKYYFGTAMVTMMILIAEL